MIKIRCYASERERGGCDFLTASRVTALAWGAQKETDWFLCECPLTLQASVQGPAIPYRKKPTVQLEVLSPKSSKIISLADDMMLSVLLTVPHWCLTCTHKEQGCRQWICVGLFLQELPCAFAEVLLMVQKCRALLAAAAATGRALSPSVWERGGLCISRAWSMAGVCC